jgi:hypothetical protein
MTTMDVRGDAIKGTPSFSIFLIFLSAILQV